MAIVVEAEASDLVSLQYSAVGEGVIQWRGRDPFCGVVGNFSSTVAGLPHSSHDENRSGEFVMGMGIGMTRMGWDGMRWDEMG